MQAEIRNVLDNYYATRIRLSGKATVIGTPDQTAVLSEIPKQIESHLAGHGRAHLYKIKGSIGLGNIARVPWVGIFRAGVTDSAENGYYIVLLFSENMSRCYLSLNQGITAIEKMYTKQFARRKMLEAATEARKRLICSPEADLGKIDLGSTGDLARAYEAAAIVSFRYVNDDLPSDSIFFSHLDELLEHYESLYREFGPNLHSLFDVSEGEFQQVVLEKAAAQQPNVDLDEIGAESPKSILGTKTFVRSPTVAANAIRAAQFTCEIDPNHWTFSSKAKKQRYVEAHHLIPISQQNLFDVSLDVVANVVSLCATCHRMMHFGLPEEKKSYLLGLLKERKVRLRDKAIEIKDNEFLQFYSGKVVLED
jgi:5-methylcytosine-specific restriction protein A